MDINQAIRERRSIRKYKDMPIEAEVREKLDAFVAQVNEESGLHITVRYDDPEGFDSRLAHYGNFRNVANYIVLAGCDCPDFEERCGYYGEKIVLEAQRMGLNTCWTALTFNKKMVSRMVPEGERFCMVIALGYGDEEGKVHRCKPLAKIVSAQGDLPEWFKTGVKAAMLAPTAINQQNFRLIWQYGEASAKTVGFGPYIKVDLGIVKYHFEAASGHKIR